MPEAPALVAAAAPAVRGAATRRRRRALRSLFHRYRPLLAAALTVWLLLALVPVVRPPTATTPVLVAAADLAAGRPVESGDVELVHYPSGLAPPGSLSSPGAVLGEHLGHPVAAGVPLTEDAVARDAWGLDAGESAVPVRLADPLVATLLTPGTEIELVTADGETATTLAPAARVLAVLTQSPGPGLLGGSGAGSADPALVLLAVPRSATVPALEASAEGRLFAALPGG